MEPLRPVEFKGAVWFKPDNPGRLGESKANKAARSTNPMREEVRMKWEL